MDDNKEKEIREALAKLATAQAELQAMHNSWIAATDSVIPKDVKEAMSEVNEEFAPRVQEAEQAITKLKAQVQELVTEYGKTVKGLRLQAVFFKPKAMWNNEKLEGYAASHPEVLALREFGKASVQIREVGNSKGSE